ncbi:hypothetical protein K505DRAFT_246593 [Melanomma pulvis-pyrius CBS 109.77]|uniref:Uncharacterized protein n=1 Tax=Melanomma pulvis-pyrius CBS 109.77 TaxID=1314802 RepID=A0A6A6X7G8_9PLEO|nr:hypothetical protein K505DRAFT_246593 [Melanomma pulvis-pyrius CBS 109.77]
MTPLTVAALSVIDVYGMNSMYVLVYCSGYIKALINLKVHVPHYFPGSHNPILTYFTGIKPLDQVLTLAGVTFVNVTDGSAPQLSLYGFYFAGKLVSIFTVMIIEGVRDGNKGVSCHCKHPGSFVLRLLRLS